MLSTPTYFKYVSDSLKLATLKDVKATRVSAHLKQI